jgi:hypothetical protein
MKRIFPFAALLCFFGCQGRYPFEAVCNPEAGRTLSIQRPAWTPASAPADAPGPRGRLVWYNPAVPVAILEIWPDRTCPLGCPKTTAVLELLFRPDPAAALPRLSWGGMMMLPFSGMPALAESLFLEITIRGDHGVLHLDLGRISEEVIPNGILDSEDRIRNGVRNGLLEEDEDTGLDGMYGLDPPDPFHPHVPVSVNQEYGNRLYASPYDFRDLDGDQLKDESEPWSFDDWENPADSASILHANGTEQSVHSSPLISPDTEDINGNGELDLRNDYFEWSFSLDKTGPDTALIAGNRDQIRPCGTFD